MVEQRAVSSRKNQDLLHMNGKHEALCTVRLRMVSELGRIRDGGQFNRQQSRVPRKLTRRQESLHSIGVFQPSYSQNFGDGYELDTVFTR